MIGLNKTMDNTYLKYQEMDMDYTTALKYCTYLTTKLLKMFLAIYIFTVVMLITYPMIYNAIYGEKLLIMQFLLPGIDPKTPEGFLMHNVFHVILILMGGFGNFAGDMFFFILILHVPLLKDILRIKFKKLSEIALKTRGPQKTIPLIKDIVQWHQSYNK